MTVFEMFGQSAALTVLGMGMVYLFLAIMIVSVNVTGKIIHAVGADKDVLKESGGQASPAQADTGAVMAAISAAVEEHRKNNQGSAP